MNEMATLIHTVQCEKKIVVSIHKVQSMKKMVVSIHKVVYEENASVDS